MRFGLAALTVIASLASATVADIDIIETLTDIRIDLAVVTFTNHEHFESSISSSLSSSLNSKKGQSFLLSSLKFLTSVTTNYTPR